MTKTKPTIELYRIRYTNGLMECISYTATEGKLSYSIETESDRTRMIKKNTMMIVDTDSDSHRIWCLVPDADDAIELLKGAISRHNVRLKERITRLTQEIHTNNDFLDMDDFSFEVVPHRMAW